MAVQEPEELTALCESLAGLSLPDESQSKELHLQPLMVCPVCFKLENLKVCGVCKRKYYCGIEHQKQDWENHQSTCFPQEKRSRSFEEYMELFLNFSEKEFDKNCPIPSADLSQFKEPLSASKYADVVEDVLAIFMDCGNMNGWQYRKGDRVKFGLPDFTQCQSIEQFHAIDNDDKLASFCGVYGAYYIALILIEDFLPFYIFQVKLSEIQGRLIYYILQSLYDWLEKHDLMLGFSSEKKRELKKTLRKLKDIPRMQTLESRIKSHIARNQSKRENNQVTADLQAARTGNVVVGVFSVANVNISKEIVELICECNFMDKLAKVQPMNMKDDNRIFKIKCAVALVVSCEVGWSIIGSIVKTNQEDDSGKLYWDFLDVSGVSFNNMS